MHWADQYVGLAGEGRNPCWLLVRRVWIERAGFFMPRFDAEDDPEMAFAREAQAFAPVAIGCEQELDAVMIGVPMRKNGLVVQAEKHIGVVVAKGLVLHVEQDRLSRIDAIDALHVSRILRGGFAP